MTAARPAGSAAPALDEYIALQHGFNDHRIRAVLELSGHVDDDRLAAAVEASFIAIPLLTCGFVLTPRGPHAGCCRSPSSRGRCARRSGAGDRR